MLKRRGPQQELGPALSGGLEGRPTGQVPLARDQSAAASAFPASSSAVKPGTAEGGQQGERRGTPLPAGHCPPALSPRWRPERTCDRGSGQPGTPAGTAGPSAPRKCRGVVTVKTSLKIPCPPVTGATRNTCRAPPVLLHLRKYRRRVKVTTSLKISCPLLSNQGSSK